MHGWIILDKPSRYYLRPCGGGKVKIVTVLRSEARAPLEGEEIGHAGTLDPLASGVLPLALGEATKTVPYMMDAAEGLWVYRDLGRGARYRRL